MPAQGGIVNGFWYWVLIVGGCACGLAILAAFIGSQTIDSYEPPKRKPDPEPELPKARVIK